MTSKKITQTLQRQILDAVTQKRFDEPFREIKRRNYALGCRILENYVRDYEELLDALPEQFFPSVFGTYNIKGVGEYVSNYAYPTFKKPKYLKNDVAADKPPHGFVEENLRFKFYIPCPGGRLIDALHSPSKIWVTKALYKDVLQIAEDNSALEKERRELRGSLDAALSSIKTTRALITCMPNIEPYLEAILTEKPVAKTPTLYTKVNEMLPA